MKAPTVLSNGLISVTAIIPVIVPGRRAILVLIKSVNGSERGRSEKGGNGIDEIE